MTARIGVVTVSDRVSRGEYEDLSGPAVREYLLAHLLGEVEVVERVVADERDQIAALLVELVDTEGCCLVVTTGGTGPAPRDVTPEATAEVCDRLLPGFGERMRAVSWEKVPSALLSRQVAGLRGSGLILNLPGSPGAIRECLEAVLPAIPHGIALAGGPRLELDAPPKLPH
ncbi:MAG: molybdopterin adenylyltransferase [Acidobacteria bacterium]|nr:molybdopterin adenylyltransferase [Acidobacteriota bacterium]